MLIFWLCCRYIFSFSHLYLSLVTSFCNVRTDIVLCKAIGLKNGCFSFEGTYFRIQNMILISWQTVQIIVIHVVKNTKAEKFSISSNSHPKNIRPYDHPKLIDLVTWKSWLTDYSCLTNGLIIFKRTRQLRLHTWSSPAMIIHIIRITLFK